MIILEMFSVYDSGARAFLRPFTAPTIEMALRTFREILRDPSHEFTKFPEDYTLFHVGSFDQKSGVLRSLDTPHSLGVAITLLPGGQAAEQGDMIAFGFEERRPGFEEDSEASDVA